MLSGKTFEHNDYHNKIDEALKADVISDEIVRAIKKKRGRKSNKELELLKKYNETKKNSTDNTNIKVPKKRGRKPKGGKLIKPINDDGGLNDNKISNIILHLKCNTCDLKPENSFISNMDYNPNIEKVKPFDHFESDTFNNSQYFNIEVDNPEYIQTEISETQTYPCNKENNTDTSNTEVSMKLIWTKLKELQHKLNKNSINDKKSSCFWCTYDFDNPAIYIPKFEINDNYEVYGCFCSPECATAHLFKEHIDTSTRWERYAMLNSIYSDVYNYNDNIKPAPNPYYLLDKYYGELTIQEYRTLLRKGKQLLIVNKPLTHVLPELVEETTDSSSSVNKPQYKLARKKPAYNKLKTSTKSWAF